MNKKAFTLVETAFILLIVAVAAAILFAVTQWEIERYRVTEDKANLRGAFLEAMIGYSSDETFSENNVFTEGSLRVFAYIVPESGKITVENATLDATPGDIYLIPDKTTLSSRSPEHIVALYYDGHFYWLSRKGLNLIG